MAESKSREEAGAPARPLPVGITSRFKQNTKYDHAAQGGNLNGAAQPTTPSIISCTESHQAKVSDIAVGSKPKCPLLEKTPTEIRLKIFGYLLIDPSLGEFHAYRTHQEYSCPPNERKAGFALFPRILGTCKQIYLEASNVLYSNTFIIFCLQTRETRYFPLFSPVTRYCTLNVTYNYREDIKAKAPGLVKVQRWKVLLVRPNDSQVLNHTALLSQVFCLSISNSPLKSLELVILPRQLEVSIRDTYGIFSSSAPPLRDILNPFRLLRGVQNIYIRDANFSDFPQNRFAGVFAPFDPEVHGNEKLVEHLTDLIKGSAPIDGIDFFPEMFRNLVLYAQSFEHRVFFKGAMENKSDGGGFSQNKTMYKKNESTKHSRRSNLCHHPCIQPFYNHPVEKRLRKAGASLDWGYTGKADFKKYRAKILSYLEPQYRRIVIANRELTEYIKEQKIRWGFLVPRRNLKLYSDAEFNFQIANSLLLLRKYVAALFERDAPREIKLHMMLHQDGLDDSDGDLPVHVAMKEVEAAFKAHDWTTYREAFRLAVDALDDLYLEICSARKELFHADGLMQYGLKEYARGFDINSPARLQDEKIDWTVSEPRMRPWANEPAFRPWATTPI